MAYPQSYVAVPTGKTITDLATTPGLAMQYSDDNTITLATGYEWISNDITALEAAIAAAETTTTDTTDTTETTT